MQSIQIKIIFVTASLSLIIGCSNPGWIGKRTSTIGPSDAIGPSDTTGPSYQTNMYGRLDGWNPVEFNAKPFSSLEQHSFCEEGGDYDPDISADGKLIVFGSLRHAPNPDIYVKQIAGATATRLTSDPASEIQPCFSPDGTRVAYASNRAGNWDIWVTQVDGSNSVRMTTSVSNDIHPSWSPDGKYLVYCSYGTRSRQWELWVINAGNPSAKKWIGYGMFPEWNPNPKINKIAFQLARYRGSQWFSVWTIDMVDGEAKFPTEIITNLNYACICPSWSFDGGNLVYSTVNRSSYEKDTEPAVPNTSGEDIWIVNLDGKNNHRLTSSDASDFSPTWSPDNRVFFCSNRKYIDNIWSAKPSEVDFTPRQQPVQMSSSHPQSGGIRAN